MLILPTSFLQTSSDRSTWFLNMRFSSGGGILWGFRSISQKYMGKEHQPIYSPDSANRTTCLWCHLKRIFITSRLNCVPVSQNKIQRRVFTELSWDSAQNDYLRKHTENTQRTLSLRCEKLWRCIARIYPASCLPRDCIVLTWLYFSSPRENLTVHRYSLPFSLHLVYKYSVPKATCSSTAPKEKKTQLGFERSWKLPWLHSKMVL